MNLTNLFIYVPPILALLALIIKWPGMKKYIAAGMFAAWWAYTICHVAVIWNFWSYPSVAEEIIVDSILVPVAAMFWIRYAPQGIINLFLWNLAWTVPLTGLEYLSERFSNVIKYHNGYDWYYSFMLWFISWFIWYGFHRWLSTDHELRF